MSTDSMTNGRVAVGVIGAGAMGASHARTIATAVPAARLVSVFDMDADRAKQVAVPFGSDVAASPESLIDTVDAVVVASPDSTHADLVIACIEAGKPVLCEKPLAVTGAEARRVVDAEMTAGRRLAQVGFNRRFDPGFVALKAAIDAGELGEIRLAHGIHRNASNTTSVDDASLVTGSMIHEFDTFRWLFGDDIAAIRVESPVSEGFRDPQLATLWMRGGQLVTAEVFVNAAYGYDVRVEVVGTGGSATLEPRHPVVSRIASSQGSVIGSDFVAHFIESYRLELAAWADAAASGGVVATAASAWDGYAANLVAEAGVRALHSGLRQLIDVPQRPTMYA